MFLALIAATIGVEAQTEALDDRRALSAWIDQRKDGVPKEHAPSAKRIAGEKGLELTDEVRRPGLRRHDKSTRRSPQAGPVRVASDPARGHL